MNNQGNAGNNNNGGGGGLNQFVNVLPSGLRNKVQEGEQKLHQFSDKLGKGNQPNSGNGMNNDSGSNMGGSNMNSGGNGNMGGSNMNSGMDGTGMNYNSGGGGAMGGSGMNNGGGMGGGYNNN